MASSMLANGNRPNGTQKKISNQQNGDFVVSSVPRDLMCGDGDGLEPCNNGQELSRKGSSRVFANIGSSRGPRGVAINHEAGWVFVADDGDYVLVFDKDTGEEVHRLKVELAVGVEYHNGRSTVQATAKNLP